MTDAEKIIRQEIADHGPMTFKRFVELSLYHPLYGYYNQKKIRRGREGDYFTSYQVGGLFASVFVEAILSMKEALGTEQFHLIEVGSGSGEFIEGVLSELEKRAQIKGIQTRVIEASIPARDALFKKLARFPRVKILNSWDEIEAIGGVDGLIFSNELIDAFPFHRLVREEKGWKEIFVDVQNDRLVERTGPLSQSDLLDEINFTEIDLEPGQEIEARPMARSVLSEWSAILKRGFVGFFDYGYPRFDLYHPKRAKGTWLSYRKHKIEPNPFAAIGDQDITAHVDFSQWAKAGEDAGLRPDLFCSQASFLTLLGGEKIEKFLMEAPESEKAPRAGVVQQLIHPRGMGESFWGLFFSKETEKPGFFEKVPNRIKRVLI